jgi:hypothetical protein
MKRRSSEKRHGNSWMASAALAVETLESRVHLDASPWAWNAAMVDQPQAITDFPFLTGSGETVVVLDTGIDQTNPGDSNINVVAWQDYVGSSSTPVDTVGHGTGVSGIIAGGHFDFDGVQDQGVAPGVNLIELRTDTESSSTSWKTQAQRISDALTWIIDNLSNYNIVAVNMSTGSNKTFTAPINSTNDPQYAIDSTLESQFATLAADGIFLGAAAGNDGATAPDSDEYPAVDPNVYAASSVNSSDQISSDSTLNASQGFATDILAPGENDIMPYGDISGQPFIDYGSGTSFSIPYVVGAAALLKQVDPNLTPAQVMQLMDDSGTPQYDATTNLTFPLLNIDAAIKLAYADYGNSNQSLGAASQLSFDSNGVAGSDSNVSLLDEQDYYRFSVSLTSNVTFSIATSDGETDPTMQLLNSSGAVVESLANGQTASLAAGTYYVRVTGGSVTLNGTYNLALTKVTNDSQNNHTPESATPIDVSSGFGQADNNVLVDGATDYYSFTLSSTSSVTVNVNPSGTYPTATLLNANTTTVAAIPNGGTTQTLAAGEYLISVASPNSGDETYNVTVSVTPETPEVGAPGSTATAAKIAYDSSGNLDMAFFNSTTQTLQFAQRNTSGTWSSPVTVDSTVGAGTELSIAVAPNGNIGIAYYDSVNANLDYAVFNGSSWNISTPDYYKTTGLMPSLTFNSQSQPLIAYYDQFYGQLRVANEVGSNWGVFVMDSGGVGLYPSIAYDTPAGVYGVAYDDPTHGEVKYAYYRRGFRSLVIDSGLRSGGSEISLAIDPTTQNPAVSFYDVAHTSLDYSIFNGNTWNTQAVTSTRNQGEFSSLTFDGSTPEILYYTPTYAGIDEADPSGRTWVLSRLSDGGIDLAQATDSSGDNSILWITTDGVQIMDL